MRKILLKGLGAVTLAVGLSVAAYAAEDHSTPGTPGTPGCRGQTTAYLAQAAKNGLIDQAFHGIGGVARFSDMTVAEWHAVVEAYCAM